MQVADFDALFEETENPKIDQADIDRFDESNGFRLPTDFAAFLLHCNGGEPAKDIGAEWQSELYQDDFGRYYPAVFYELNGNGYQSIRSLMTIFSEMEIDNSNVPHGIFCVADDMCGNYLSIDLRPENFGQIAMVSHEQLDEAFDDPEAYQVLASSFSDFVGLTFRIDENGNRIN
jgi:cell wall assembly regulator SMI1